MKHNRTRCDDVDIHDNMIVIYNNTENITLVEAIRKIRPGETIEGIHPNQYDKLISILEADRNRKFQYSVDIKYGDWRFILFDNNNHHSEDKQDYVTGKYYGLYTDPKYHPTFTDHVTPIPL